MKHCTKNTGMITKKNMNLTVQVADVLRAFNKKPAWKNKTNKLTKTMNNKTNNIKPSPMTQDDIDRLFRNNSKQKSNALVPTKVSTEVVEPWGAYDNKDYVNSVKFLRVDDQWDRLLTGIPIDCMDQNKIDQLFQVAQKPDLTAQFKKDYQVGKIIGEGAYASVRVAIYRPLSKTIAIKVYEKNKIKEPQRKKSVRRQIRILQMLNHPNIVKIFDVVETNNHLNIVMQFLNGTSLGAYLKGQPGNKINQKNCKKIFKDLAKALRYMHSLNIAHRDIKLENIILDQNLSPKMIDFGFSTCIQTDKRVKIFCGTPSYMAPEVVQRKQYRGQTADIWALGVLLFVSLTGIFPFKGSTDQELYRKINNAEYPKGELIFNKAAADLISKMLRIDPQQRITSSEMVQHYWFSSDVRPQSNRKKATECSIDQRKRVNTMSSNHSKENKWANKTSKKILAQTCKQNLQIQLKMALKSPSARKQLHSYRKVDKQNTMKILKSQKTTFRQNVHNPIKKQVKKEKTLLKTHSKVIDLLRMEMKKKQTEKSKSRSKNRKL